MASINGLQTQGLNYSSIDGLTNIYTANGLIDPSLYIPYTGADKTVNLNTRTLTNIANASALTDAVNLQTMNAKTFIGDISGYRIESLSGNQNEYFALKTEYGSGNLCSQEDYTSKYLYGQAIRFYNASPSFTFIGSIVQVQFDSSLTINASTLLRLTSPNININGIITGNGSQIKGIGVATISGDAVAFQQLGSYIPYTGATSNPNFNTRLLTNIGDGVSNNDAISLQQLNAKRYDTIQNGALSVLVNCGLTNLSLQADPIGQIILYNRATINPTSNATDMFVVKNVAGTSIFSVDTTTPAINCNSVKLTNVANATVSGDAVNYGQLTTWIPSSISSGSTSVVCNGTNITNTVVGSLISNLGSQGVLTQNQNGFNQALTTSLPTSTRTWGINVASPSAIEFTHTATGGGTVGFFNFTRKVKVQPVANSTDVLTIANTAGTTIFSVDTTTPAINCNSNKITNLANATVSGDAVNYGQLLALGTPFELTRAGTSSYVRVNIDDVIVNASNTGAVWHYYNGSPISVQGSSGNEVYVADTGFRWRKGSSAGTEMYKISAISTVQTLLDIPTDSLFHRGKMIMRPYTSDGSVLQIQSLNGTNTLASFVTNATLANQYLTLHNNRITDVADPITIQDVATKNYVDSDGYKPQPHGVSNGDFLINQGTGGGTLCDRWLQFFQNPFATGTIETITDLAGFSKCYNVTTTSASPNLIHTYQRIEGTFASPFLWGRSGGVGATISFWMKSTITNHRMGVSIYIPSADYECCATVVVAVANVWTRVSCYIPNAPIGITVPHDNSGANYITINPQATTSSGVQWGNGVEGVWSFNGTSIRRLGLANGSTIGMNVSGTQTVRWTGVQIDIGNRLRPRNELSFTDHLRHCRRYYYRITATSTYHVLGIVGRYSTVYTIGQISLPEQMRADAVWTISNITALTVGRGTGVDVACSNVVPFGTTTENVLLLIVVATANDGSRYWLNTIGAWMDMSATLS